MKCDSNIYFNFRKTPIRDNKFNIYRFGRYEATGDFDKYPSEAIGARLTLMSGGFNVHDKPSNRKEKRVSIVDIIVESIEH